MGERVKVGDIVKMNKGYSPLGIVMKVQYWTNGKPNQPSKVPVHILWSDCILVTIEKVRDLEVVIESR